MHENIAGHRTEAPPYFFVTLLRATAILYAENITSLFLLCYKSAIHLYLYSLNSIILEIVVSPNLRKMQFCTQTAKESHPYPAEKSRTQNRQTAQYQLVGRRAALHTSEERAHSRFTEEQPCTYPKKGRTPGSQKSSPAHIRRTGAPPIRGKAQDTQRRSPL